jgi:hypothetical protein
MKNEGYNPRNHTPQENELSIDAVDLILTEDIAAYSKRDIVNLEQEGPKKKTKRESNDEGSPWRLTA